MVSGFNEVNKSLKFTKIQNLPKLVIFAVNIAKNELSGGTDEKIQQILEMCKLK